MSHLASDKKKKKISTKKSDSNWHQLANNIKHYISKTKQYSILQKLILSNRYMVYITSDYNLYADTFGQKQW